MSEQKNESSVKPLIFRVDQSLHDFIEDEMIRRREFNKSEITREIFMMGLALYKKKNKE